MSVQPLRTNPVLRALERAKLDEQIVEWERKEKALTVAVVRRLGCLPPADVDPQAAALLAEFGGWCEGNGVRSFPAQPASIAQFVLDRAVAGSKRAIEFVAAISEFYSTRGLPNPAATSIVAAALERAGDAVPPRSWPKGLKAEFARLPATLKVYVVGHDAQRERVLRRAQNEAALAKRELKAARTAETTTGEIDGRQDS
jgi:hypothetical protein